MRHFTAVFLFSVSIPVEIIEERDYFWEFVYFHKYEKIMVLGAAGQMYLMWWSEKDYWALPGTEVHQSLFISPTRARSCIQLANKRLHWDQRRHKIPVQPSRLVIIRLSRSINKYLNLCLSLSGSDSTRLEGYVDWVYWSWVCWKDICWHVDWRPREP